MNSWFKCVIALFLTASAVLSSPTTADDIRPATLQIEATSDTRFAVSLKVPVRNGVRQNMQVVLSEDAVIVSPKQVRTVQNAYVESFEFERRQGLSDLTVTMEGLKGLRGDVLLRAVNMQGDVNNHVLNTENASITLKAPTTASKIDTIIQYIILGVEHILIGLDHLLFVACLVYISNTKRKLIYTITGFTLAHSVTLILSATNVVVVPIKPVEAVIALSIVFLAWEIAKNKQNSLSMRYPVLVSSSFGLLHGFGFAAVLAEFGLPANEKIAALLSFNIGVEIGQLLFVAVLFILFISAKAAVRSLSKETLRFPISYICGIIATFWMIQRVL
ncbi:HupE/UreJ family protein [Thalassotalea agarivorans]|uniref:HupE / UreJ protein n=1 Tax=Thalassotalea agarivorans TaxID=349064 RepID=A0A1I0E4J8_THASX|nr:HupE/UreJ family protein [Thalassotalea agarivorans]SET40070.1 HupE / UreJ protein [Thalassotalea agarivorans]